MAVKMTLAAELKKHAGTNTLLIGAERTLKALRRGTLAKIFLASNCAQGVRETARQYCGIAKIPCEEVKEDDVEVGVLCK